MRNKIEKGVDLNLRQFIKSLGYIAGGTALLASTPWLFRKMLHAAAHDAGVQLRQIEARQQSADHPILWGVEETSYLKFYLFQVV